MKTVGNYRNRLFFSTLMLLSLMMPNFVMAAVWTPVSSGITEHLYDVWGTSSSEVYAVGNNKTILFFDGSSWSRMDTGLPGNTALVAVWGISATDIYAAGGDIILHYDGTEWTELETGDFTSSISGGIWGSDENDIFFIGNPIKHYDGATFTDETASSDCNRDIWGTAANNVYAVGQLGTIQRYNGSSWSDMESGLGMNTIFGIWGSSATDIFAVANGGAILHYNGSGSIWTEMDNPGQYLYEDIWGTSADNVYAVGTSGQIGGIQHYNGTEWKEMISNTTEKLKGVWVSSDGVVFAVGKNGTVLQNGDSGSQQPPPEGYIAGYAAGHAAGYEEGFANGQDSCNNPVQSDNCAILEENFDITMPCIDVFGITIPIGLENITCSDDPSGYYWKLNLQ